MTTTGPRRSGYASGSQDHLSRLDKIEGQIRGIHKMIESGRRYPDVVNQLVSATRALQELVVGMLTDHINDQIDKRHDEALDPAALDEVAAAIRRAVRL